MWTTFFYRFRMVWSEGHFRVICRFSGNDDPPRTFPTQQGLQKYFRKKNPLLTRSVKIDKKNLAWDKKLEKILWYFGKLKITLSPKCDFVFPKTAYFVIKNVFFCCFFDGFPSFFWVLRLVSALFRGDLFGCFPRNGDDQFFGAQKVTFGGNQQNKTNRPEWGERKLVKSSLIASPKPKNAFFDFPRQTDKKYFQIFTNFSAKNLSANGGPWRGLKCEKTIQN